MIEVRIRRKFVKPLFLLILALLLCSTSSAQQPFVTDDTDTTPRGRFHFEFSNEIDWLRPSSLPTLRQNTASFELGYGLLDNVEIGIEVPFLTIFNSRGTFQTDCLE